MTGKIKIYIRALDTKTHTVSYSCPEDHIWWVAASEPSKNRWDSAKCQPHVTLEGGAREINPRTCLFPLSWLLQMLLSEQA